MTQDNLVKFKTPETPENFSDALSALIRSGAQQIIAQAVEAELNELLGKYQALKDDSGRQAIVRNRARHIELTDYSPGTIRTVTREEFKTIRMNLDDDY